MPVKIAFLVIAGLGLAMAQPPFGGRGGPRPKTKILKDFDKDGNGYLNAAERKAARAYLANQPRRGRGPGFGAGNSEPPRPGPQVKPADVKIYAGESLYDLKTLRTFFLEFEDKDWDQELDDFYHTDIDVPAKLTVDGKVYANVGVAYRGNTSYSTVPPGRKKSLDLSMNMVNGDQRLGGYRSLNLLNSAADPTFMRTALYHYVARQYIAAPKANFVRVVINGESWGVYVNTQQINSDFAKDFFGTTKGARWKIAGSPGGRGGLAYLGDDAAPYRSIYEIKSKDDPKSWADPAPLCKVLNQTPPETLEEALKPILDVDAALKFLALDKAVINNDGFWTRASDYSLYEEPNGRFHIVPWDANETFREPERMGRRGGEPIADNAELDPFTGANDPGKALLHRLLAVPALRARYLGYVKDIAQHWLDWNKLGPLVQEWQTLIAADVESDTRKIFSTAAFRAAVTRDNFEPGYGPTAPPEMALKTFLDQRRKFLLAYKDK